MVAGFSSANNACPQCSHKPYNIDTVKPSISSRKTVKSWLKAEKLKADEQAAQKDNAVEETTQAHVDGPVDEGVNGQSELGLHGTDSAMDTEGVLPSTEVKISTLQVLVPGVDSHRIRMMSTTHNPIRTKRATMMSSSKSTLIPMILTTFRHTFPMTTTNLTNMAYPLNYLKAKRSNQSGVRMQSEEEIPAIRSRLDRKAVRMSPIFSILARTST